MHTIFGVQKDYVFMGYALHQAQIAFDNNEVPIGALVIDPYGEIIGVGHNEVESACSQIAHAEMIALRAAGKKIGNWRLANCWLYVTLEPCGMCMGMARLSRLAGVVYGASSPFFGYRLDNIDTIRVYKYDTPLVIAHVRSQESIELLKKFFKEKRKNMSNKKNNFEDVRKVLLQRKIELEENLASLSKEKITDDQVKDNGDEALASTMEVLKMSFQDSERNEYEHIMQALAKIDSGTYGICIDCGEPISEKRLTLNPNVARCLVCQETFEDNAE